MTPEDHLSAQEVAALKETFRVQTEELLEDYGRYVLELERSLQPADTLKAVQRVVHTIKGDSMSLEFDKLAELAHLLEDQLEALRQSNRTVDRPQIDLLLACGDKLGTLLRGYCTEPPLPPIDIAPLCRELDEMLGAAKALKDAPATRAYRLAITFARQCKTHSAGAYLIRQRLERLGRIQEVDPDPENAAIEGAPCWVVTLQSAAEPVALQRAAGVPGISSRVQVDRHEDSEPMARTDGVGKLEPSQHCVEENQLEIGSSSISAGPTSSDQLRMEVVKIDRIMNLVGELVIGRSMVSQALSDLSAADQAALTRLHSANHFLERTLTELQAVVLKIRMVPVDHVFRRFPRVVRDLAHSAGKEVQIDVQGASTELDKGIVDALHEPLLHLVRNAIDHGLESPKERTRAGKPLAGRLTLAASYEGNHVHILIEDDGRGIELEQVRQRAVSLGLARPQEVELLSKEEVLQFLYQPGFSTRESVSTVSGRGIGMDVVGKTIEALKGSIEIETEPGRGTRFQIRLPLTLAILRAVLVESGGATFAVPLSGVTEIVRLFHNNAESVLGNDVLRLRDQVVPLMDLQEALGLTTNVGEKTTRAFVVVVGESDRKVGLRVDNLHGEHELVVKPIEDPLLQNPHIAGASILGDGKVVLILNVRELAKRKRQQPTWVEA